MSPPANRRTRGSADLPGSPAPAVGSSAPVAGAAPGAPPAAAPAESSSAATAPAAGRLALTLTNLPSRLPVTFFWAALVVCVAVMLGMFRPVVVLPAIGLVVALTWRILPERVPATREFRSGAAWALGLAVAWVLVNVAFAGEVLLVQRDPGFLTLEGFWLTTHADPSIPIRTAADVAERVPDVQVISDAFWRFGDEIHAQGAKTVPGLLAMVGWVLGVRGVLVGNLLIGALGLLAVYDVARRLISPRWALVPVAALALSTPMVYFSRSAFTEPTNIVLTFGGLAVLWGAFRDPRLSRFALGGAMVGATALSRIDGAAVSAGLILGLGVVAAVSAPEHRRTRIWGLITAAAASLLMVGLGYLDLALHSAGYLEDHRSLYVQLIGLLVACLAAVGGLIVALRWTRLRGWLVARRATLGTAAAVLVVASAILLASRPLWLTMRLIVPGSAQEWFIAAAQRVAGVAVDGTRSYDEATVTWLYWYLGPITLVLGVAGAALLLRRSIVGWRPEVLVLLATLGIPAMLYLIRPAITPDQVWAMRRFLPAVIPAALLMAGWTLPRIHRAAKARWQRIGAGLLVAGVLLPPLATWGTLIVTTEYGGRADQVATVCQAVTGRPVVVVRDAGPPWLPTLRIMCDVDVVEVGPRASAEELAEIREVWGEDVLVLTDARQLVPWSGAWPDPWLSTRMARWPHSLYPSRSPIRFTSEVWIATVEQDGSVTPLAPPG
ncbi:MAG TPA: glycosyltransferase family 39 protein [Motilibacterales bacterium]|nr:glycosyltransferase family 39 protein [Motilibacterales bacterium]